MNAKLMRDFINWPTDQQEELLKMVEEADRYKAQNEIYRVQLIRQYEDMLTKVPWWRRVGMRFGYWLQVACTPKWMYGVFDQ